MDYSYVMSLAAELTGSDLDKIKDEELEDTLDERLLQKFGIDLDKFEKVADALLPLTPIVEVEGTKGGFHTFVDKDNNVLAVCKARAIG